MDYAFDFVLPQSQSQCVLFHQHKLSIFLLTSTGELVARLFNNKQRANTDVDCSREWALAEIFRQFRLSTWTEAQKSKC